MSCDKKQDNDNNNNRSTSIPTPVLEYYKNYSLNKQLSKYFTGTSSVSYIPEIVQSNGDDDDDDYRSVKDTEEQQANQSPTSSVISNRKLEWDNGADIGYNNCSSERSLYKSLSLPVLKSIDHKSNNSRSTTTTTSSSSSTSIPVQIIVTESIDSGSQKSNILMDLKRKIGSPDAESTPKLVNVKESTVKADKIKKYIKLCVTKPVVIDCIDRDVRRADKDIQTSPIINGNSSKIVQTGDSLKRNSEIIQSNQSIIVINYCNDSDKQSTETIRTNSELASNCDSFEYLSGENCEKNSNKTGTSSNLSDLIQKNQSNYLITDIERSVELLQRLLKSKRYDSTTKKRYIRKIVDKIMNSKYIDDDRNKSNITKSSKMKSDENSNGNTRSLQDNLPWYPTLSVKTFSNEYLPKSNNNRDDNDNTKIRSVFTNLQENHINSSTSSSDQSWKNSQTLSELLFENCKGQGDSLVNYVSKERQYELEWINGSIHYLEKLKKLLEKNSNNLENNQRTTMVYMVSENSRGNYRKIGGKTDSSSSSNSYRSNKKSSDDNCGKAKKTREPSLVGHGEYKSQQNGERITVEVPLDEHKQILSDRICNILEQFENVFGKSERISRSTSSNSSNNKCLCENKSVQVECCNCQRLEQKSTQIDNEVQTNCQCSSAVQIDGLKSSNHQVESCNCQQLQQKSTQIDNEVQTNCQCSSAVQTDDLKSSKITNSSSSSSSSSPQSLKSCNCCKGKFDKLYTSKKKLPTIPLCRPCYYQLLKCPQQSMLYNNPMFQCRCYTTIRTETLNEIKRTVDELNDLEDYCTCLNRSDDDNKSKYCHYCRCKLKTTVNTKNSIAYMLTFEHTTIPKVKKKKIRRKPLEEIKVKIPTIRSRQCTCTTDNKRKNLQDYLIKNRPKFVQLAELRRQAVISAKLQRELQQEEKKLVFLQNNRVQQHQQQQQQQRLFSAREMKENTKKHYKKLPEVQQKLVVQKEKQIRQANRLITDIFNRKLKENVLKGKLDYPTDLYVVNL